MPVCLTGDVHHRSLRTADQSVLDRPEPETAVEYAKIVADAGINATLFVTGRTVDEDAGVVCHLGDFDCVEIGGHNYGAFTILGVPRSGIIFQGYRKVFGHNCPRWLQRRGIEKTQNRLESVSGNRVVSWRDHGFNNDANTYELLEDVNIRYVSDERTPHCLHPYRCLPQDIIEVPINIPPDHDHIQHAEKTFPDDWSDPFSGEVYSAEEWLHRVTTTIERIDAADGLATVLAHPACMAIVDDFDIFQRLCAELSKYETIMLSEADSYLDTDGN
jgi:hypothetical protein